MELGIGMLSSFLGEAAPYAVFATGGYLAWRFVRAYDPPRLISSTRLPIACESSRM